MASASSDKDLEFKVIIDKTTGRKLGADVKLHVDTVEILEVKGGLLQQWNDDHPELAVKRGDRIAEVSGMKDWWTQNVVLELVVRRHETEENVLLPSSEGSPSVLPPRQLPIKALLAVGLCVAAAGLAGGFVMGRSTARASAKVKHPEAVTPLKKGMDLIDGYHLTEDAEEGASVIHTNYEACLMVGDRIQLFHEARDANNHMYDIVSLNPITLRPSLTHKYERGSMMLRIHHPFSPKWCGEWPEPEPGPEPEPEPEPTPGPGPEPESGPGTGPRPKPKPGPGPRPKPKPGPGVKF